MKKSFKYFIFLILLLLFPKVALAANAKVSCGNIYDIPQKIPELTSFVITVAQVATTVILILLGTIDLFKGVTAQKEEEIKKGQQMFVKRLGIGALVFFVVLIVKLLVGAIANNTTTDNAISCIDCFISNNCNSNPTNRVVDESTKDNNDAKSTNNSNTTKKYEITETSNSNSNQKKNTNNSTNTSKASNKTIFIGDSGVVLMCDVYGLCVNDLYVAEGGVWCDYMEKVKEIVNSKIKSGKYNIVIMLGFNGALTTNDSGTNEAKRCYKKAANLAKNDWKNHNVVYVSANPCDDEHIKASGMYVTNVAINAFNKTLKSNISSSGISNLSYCETNASLNIKEIDSGDGAHYTKKGAKKVYDLIKNNCLK